MISQLTLEESQHIEQKYGCSWMCPVCGSSMRIIKKLIRHPQATREMFPCVFKCIICEKEEIYWTRVDGNQLVRLD